MFINVNIILTKPKVTKMSEQEKLNVATMAALFEALAKAAPHEAQQFMQETLKEGVALLKRKAELA